MGRNTIGLTALILALSFSAQTFAAQDVPQTFTFDGRAYSDSAATTAMLDVISTKIQILNAAQDCILYEETQSVDTTTTNGYFSIQVGSATSAAKRSANDSNNSMSTVFSNTSVTPINGKLVSNSSACTYTPAAGAKRYVRIQMTPASDSVTRTISPNMALDSVPNAIVAERAESLQGYAPAAFLQVNGAASLTQASLETLIQSVPVQAVASGTYNAPTATTATNVSGTVAIANGGTGATTAAAARTNLGLGTLAVMSPTGTADNTTYLRGDGTWATPSSAPVTSVAGRTGAVVITSSDLADFSTAADARITAQKGAANGLATLDASAKIPSSQLALVASDIPNLDASKITTGTITNNVSSTSVSGTTGQFTNLKIYDGTANYLTQVAPAGGFSASGYSVQWPAAVGSNSQVLGITSVAGSVATLGWVTPSAGSVTSVTAAATAGNPITIGGTASAPTVDIAKATTTTSGYLSSADWNTFNGKLGAITGQALTSGQVWVGDASNLAAPVAISGDATLSNAGVVTLKNTGTSGTYTKVTTDAQGRVSSGALLNVSDIQSTVSGSWFTASGGCPTGQHLDYNAVSDTVACVAFSIASSQLSLVASDIPNLDASKITTGTITNNVSSTSVSGTTGQFTNLKIYDGTANYLTQVAPSGGFSASGYSVQWPAAVGSSSQVLGITSVAGSVATLGWVTPSAGSVTSVTAAATAGNPITIGGTASAPTVDIAKATTTTSGYLSSADWNTFNGKLGAITGQALTSGQVWVGDASNLAAPVAISGDATLSNAGVVTLKNTGTAGTYTKVTTDAQGRVSSGALLNVSDIQSTVSGSWFTASGGCTTGNHLDYNAVTDTLSCVAFSVSSSQVTTALGYTPVNKAGDTMTGTLNLASNGLTVGTNQLAVVGGNVGLGTATPGTGTMLNVQGQVATKSGSITTGAVDWSSGNAITTSYDCAASITFANMRDGASYTLVVTGTGTTMCTFSTTTTGDDAAAGTITYRYSPANNTRIASSHTVYSMLRVGTVVYVSWISGF